ncbi:hypothetical protein [Achromobacter insuavis]|uniref:Uncharacterized protein n=1 Tax=Achromobacter insuavis AXX-A TaxID=1003200 RepID=F7TAE5_9BURK|nr:hypothetical protein [Achromobacter insuavis]EGP42730.1 hypothetical protein AXXA_29725 [Achromobacter insuavis AXX-A]
MSLHPVSRDVYVQRTDQAGKSVITQHLAWDSALFLASQVKQYHTDAKPEERQSVALATAAGYRAYRSHLQGARKS